MARRGQFGRLPRAVPSLTATIISIAQQANAQDDSNIMDAWQHGGTFNGKPVTDAMILAHWRERLSGVSHDDPLYDTYKNNVQQLQYQIAYSKHYTAYLKGGRTGNAAMASFFQEWSKKIPRDSEFYRQLQQDAAGYVNLARSAARASSAAADRASYVSRSNQLNRSYLQPADFLNSIVDNYARANGLISTSPNADISNLRTGGAAELYQKLSSADDSTVLYTAAGGKQITVGWVRGRMQKMSPDLRFGITPDDLNRINLRAAKGTQLLIQLNHQHGYSTTQLQTTKTAYTTRATEDGTMSADAIYWQFRTQFEAVRSDPYATNEEKLAAWNRYQGGLTALAQNVEDDNLRTRITAESNLDSSVNSVAEDPFGLGSAPQTQPGSDQSGNDITAMANDVHYLEEQKALAAQATTGGAVWTTGDVQTNAQTGQVTFVPSPSGHLMGVTADPAIVQSLAFGGSNVLSLPSAWSPTGFKNIVLQSVPVTVSDNRVATDAGGVTAPTKVGDAYIYYDEGGNQRVVYGYHDAAGTQRYTTVPPWDPSLLTSVSPTGVSIDVSRYQLQGADAVKFAQDHPEFAQVSVNGHTVPVGDLVQNPDGSFSQNSTDQNGVTKTTSVAGQPISLTFSDPSKFISWTGGARTAAPQPNEDFLSLTQAALSTPAGQPDWQKLQSLPAYRQQYQQEIDAATTRADGSIDTNLQAATAVQNSVDPGAQLTPQQQRLFNVLGVSFLPDHAAVTPEQAQAVTQHFVAGPTPPPTKPIQLPQGGHQAVAPTLANLPSAFSGYATLQRLGLLPPAVYTQTPTSQTPAVTLQGQIKVPAVPQPGPPPTTPVDPGAYHHRNDYLQTLAPVKPPPPAYVEPIHVPGIGGQ